MDRFRLKNIIILILLLLNGFLLFSLSQRRTMQRDAFRRTAEQLVALFEEDGMALDGGAISQAAPLGGAALVRDAAQEEREAYAQELEELRRTNTKLAEDISRRDDPDLIEEIAREDLGMARPGEKVFIIN